MHYELCSLHYALCTMRHALCTLHYAIFFKLFEQCTMHYALGYDLFMYWSWNTGHPPMSEIQTRSLSLEWDSQDGVDFEGSRYQFRFGPESLPSPVVKAMAPGLPVQIPA